MKPVDGRIPRAFLTLLRAGLWNRPVDSADCFPLRGDEWNALFRLAVDHTVECLVFDGVQQLESRYHPHRNLLIQWLVRVEKTAQRNAWMNGIVGEQSSFFRKEGLEPLLLKGQGIAACYHQPERRSCGDVDWYFESRKTYKMANQLIREKGIKLTYTPGFSSFYKWGECEVEHHSRMLDLHNPFCQSYLRRLEKSEESASMELMLFETPILLPSPMMQSIQVNTHILKHLLSFGIGLRQLCDAARLYFTYHKLLDGQALKAIYMDVKIIDWVYLLHQVLTKYLGIDKQYLPFEAEGEVAGDWMMEDILAMGNFGFHDKSGPEGVAERSKRKIWENARKYLPVAPMEACSFPIVHFYSRFVR